MAQTRRSLGMAGLLGCLLGSGACIERQAHDDVLASTPDGDPPLSTALLDPDFVSSAHPPSVASVLSGGISTSGLLSLAPGNYVPVTDTDDAERALAAADIVEVSGDRLYALSRFSGLTVVDSSDPAALKRVGVYPSTAIPVELYVDGGVIYALFNSWNAYACDTAGDCSWHSTSRVQALDVRDPASIHLLADVELPGNIDASRRVGDVLVLVADHVFDCWGCGEENGTTVASFDLREQSPLRLLDQLPLEGLGYVDGDNIAMSDRRVYIADNRSDASGLLPSGVQVVDISDPSGALVQGARFDVGGPIRNRWQLDEFDGVLRVFSQPRGLGSGEPPLIETFRVNSSSDVQRAGSMTIPLYGSYDELDRVLFDGARAYVGTSKKRQPTRTIELSDPAAPRLAGELELPGRLYHLEPLGDRLLALGYRPAGADGALNASLFDVTNLAAPALLGSVAFGGGVNRFADDRDELDEPGRLPEDAVSIAPELGLALVPLGGKSRDAVTCEEAYGSGVQLLDLGDTTLARRGVALQVGGAHRALLNQGRLFGVGSGSVQTFDVADRDAPRPLSALDVDRKVSGVRVLGDDVLRLGGDWFTNQSILDLTPAARAGDPSIGVPLDLSALLGQDTPACDGTWAWSDQVFVHGNHAYLPRVVQSTDPQSHAPEQRLTLYVVDIGDRSAPRAVGRLALPPAVGNEYLTGVLQTDSTLLVGRVRYEPAFYPSDPTAGAVSVGVSPDVPHFFYDVIELGDPAAPTIASRVDVPISISEDGWGMPGTSPISVDRGWGWYDGRGTGELTSGDLVLGSHAESLPDRPAEEAYYLERLDVSDPYQPRWLDPINIPGAVLDYDAATHELLTLGFVSELEPGESSECETRGYQGYFETEAQACRVTRRSLDSVVLDNDHATRTSRIVLDRTRRTKNIAVSAERVFISTSDFPSTARDGTPLSLSPDAVSTGTITLETLQREGGQLIAGPSVELRSDTHETYYDRLYARGTRAFEIADSRMTVTDTLDPGAPAQKVHELPAMACFSLEVAGDTAYCANGQNGVEIIDLRSMR